MLERLLDIAVYALMAALVAVGVGRVLDQRRDAQTVAWTEAVTRAMDRLAGTRAGYLPQNNPTGDMTAELVGSGLLPAAMIDRNSGAAPVLRNGFGGAITVTALPASFTVAQDGLPPAACIALVARARDWGRTLCANGTCVTDPAAADTGWATTTCTQTTGNLNLVSITIIP